MFDNIPTSIEHIRAGKLRVLAVTGTTRSSLLPDTRRSPTSCQATRRARGYGLGAPKSTPVEIVNKLNATVTRSSPIRCEGAV